VPAAAVHIDGAGVDMILIGTATGPWSTDYVWRADPGFDQPGVLGRAKIATSYAPVTYVPVG